jgi:glycosyltransferase involved in cell wall biosynthesis
MQNEPLVSFCFTTFKRHDYLKSTLESVLQQTYQNFEVVVSDNDPAGSGRTVVEGFQDPRFRYFTNEANLGMKKSFNRSLQKATGDYVVMIADDDPVYPDMLATLVNLAAQYPNHGLYMGGCNWFCTDPNLANFYNCKVGVNSCLAAKPIDEVWEYDASTFLLNFFNYNIFPNYLWSTCMVKRSVLLEMGGVPDYETAFLGDYAYMSIMGGHSGCVVINKALGHQTLHTQNFGRAQNDQLLILGPNFINYVSSKLSHLPHWDTIKKNMEHFVAVWLVTHLAFLKAYSVHTKDKENLSELKQLERKVFAIDFLRSYKLKYHLLTNYPFLHNRLVYLKKQLTKK